MELCKCCGQRLPFPGVFITARRRNILNAILGNTKLHTVSELTKAVYGPDARYIPDRAISGSLHYLRKVLKKTPYKILNRPYRVLDTRTGVLVVISEPELPL